MTKMKKAFHQVARIVMPMIISSSLFITCYAADTGTYEPKTTLFDDFKARQEFWAKHAGVESRATQDVINNLNNLVKNMKDLPASNTTSIAQTLNSIQEDVLNIANKMNETRFNPQTNSSELTSSTSTLETNQTMGTEPTRSSKSSVNNGALVPIGTRSDESYYKSSYQ